MAQKEPTTSSEWHDAVDAAEVALALDSARKYGLILGGPEVNVTRCLQILRRGRDRGIFPAADAIERFAKELRT